MELTELKQQLIDFIKSQSGYEDIKNEPVHVSYSDSDKYFCLVGDNLQAGIGGFGETPELSLQDFVSGWNHFKGVEWIKKHR